MFQSAMFLCFSQPCLCFSQPCFYVSVSRVSMFQSAMFLCFSQPCFCVSVNHVSMFQSTVFLCFSQSCYEKRERQKLTPSPSHLTVAPVTPYKPHSIHLVQLPPTPVTQRRDVTVSLEKPDSAVNNNVKRRSDPGGLRTSLRQFVHISE